jgi:hypothetical protein
MSNGKDSPDNCNGDDDGGVDDDDRDDDERAIKLPNTAAVVADYESDDEGMPRKTPVTAMI